MNLLDVLACIVLGIVAVLYMLPKHPGGLPPADDWGAIGIAVPVDFRFPLHPTYYLASQREDEQFRAAFPKWREA